MYRKTNPNENTYTKHTSNMKIEVFTDGACSRNGKTGAAASYAYWFPDHIKLSNAFKVPDGQPQTNNRGELLAILESVKCIVANFPACEIDLQVYTDSTYSKNCLTIWIPGWIQRGWKTAENKEVANRDLIEDAVSRLSKFKSYVITYVPAHTGKDDYLSKNNDIVDKMAVKVLTPDLDTEVKVVRSNTERFIEGCPLQLMGPPVSELALVKWCRANLDKLDQDSLETALLSALSKTAKKNGYSVEKQKLHRTSQYRLISCNLIAEKPVIQKTE